MSAVVSHRIWLKTTTPCCTAPVRFDTWTALPKQIDTRQCRRCGARWSITRTGYRIASDGSRVDRLEWICTHTYKERTP